MLSSGTSRPSADVTDIACSGLALAQPATNSADARRARTRAIRRPTKERVDELISRSQKRVLRESYRHALSVLLRCERADDEGLVDKVIADEAPNVAQRARRQVVHVAEMVVE